MFLLVFMRMFRCRRTTWRRHTEFRTRWFSNVHNFIQIARFRHESRWVFWIYVCNFSSTG